MTAPDAGTIKAVLFDKDGTLFDFSETWDAWASGLLLRLAGKDRARAAFLGDAIGYDFNAARFDPNSFVIAGTPDDAADALHPHLPELSRHGLLSILNEEAASAPMSEAVPLMPLLHKLATNNITLGVVTNDAEAPAFAHLDAANVRDAFAFVVGSDSGFGAKPDPGQMHAFCDQFDIAPHQTVMVGDSTHDLVAGRAAGMWTVAVLTGVADHADLAPFADSVMPDIGHLPGWLGLT